MRQNHVWSCRILILFPCWQLLESDNVIGNLIVFSCYHNIIVITLLPKMELVSTGWAFCQNLIVSLYCHSMAKKKNGDFINLQDYKLFTYLFHKLDLRRVLLLFNDMYDFTYTYISRDLNHNDYYSWNWCPKTTLKNRQRLRPTKGVF